MAEKLEKDSNEGLRDLEEALNEREERREKRDRLEQMAGDFVQAWDAPTTENSDRKRLRLLVEDATPPRLGRTAVIQLRLRGGKALELDPVDLSGYSGRPRPDRLQALALLDQTFDTHSDQDAVGALNAAGFRNAKGGPYTKDHV